MNPVQDGRTRLLRARDTLAIAATFAMLAAVAQLARNAYLRFVAGTFSWMSRDALWMAPLGFLVLFSGVAVALWVIGSLVPAAAGRRVQVFVFAALALFSAFLHLTWLHHAAALVLALGLGMQASSVFARRSSSLRLVQRGALVVAGLLAIAAAAERFLREPAVSRGSAPRGDAPNVLVIILDTVRASGMSVFGGPDGTTPNLERLAADGVVFEQAIAPSSWTLPSHASFFTGIRSGALDVDARRPLGAGHSRLPEVFRQAGYATGGFVANWLYTSYESGLHRGFESFHDYAISAREVVLHANLMQTAPARAFMRGDLRGALRHFVRLDWRVPPEPRHDTKRAERVVADFLHWRQDLGRPWFAFLNLFDAHGDLPPPESSARWFRKKPGGRESQEYLRNIAHMDAVLGGLFERLRADGSLDRTLVVVTSDHGEQFRGHDLVGHGNSLYIQLLHVPLVMRLPGRLPAGLRVRAPVSLTNLPRALLETAGVTNTGFPGDALVWPSLAEASDTMPVLSQTNGTDGTWDGPTDKGPMSSVIAGPYHYIRQADGREELFDRTRDPWEVRDVSGMEGGREELVRMRERLRRLTGDP